MTTAEILNLVSVRNVIVTMIENYIAESNLSDDEIHDVISEITEKINEIAPVWYAKKETTVIIFYTSSV